MIYAYIDNHFLFIFSQLLLFTDDKREVICAFEVIAASARC